MSDEFKPLIVEGEEVGEYNDTTFSFDKYQMATVELWNLPKNLMLISMIGKHLKSFIKKRLMNISMLIVKMKSSHQEWVRILMTLRNGY